MRETGLKKEEKGEKGRKIEVWKRVIEGRRRKRRKRREGRPKNE